VGARRFLRRARFDRSDRIAVGKEASQEPTPVAIGRQRTRQPLRADPPGFFGQHAPSVLGTHRALRGAGRPLGDGRESPLGIVLRMFTTTRVLRPGCDSISMMPLRAFTSFATTSRLGLVLLSAPQPSSSTHSTI